MNQTNLKNPAYYRQRRYFKLTLFAALLAFSVIVLGAYTRLTDAGLGCPDWPTCYGHLTVPSKVAESGQILDVAKAWTEMTHRYMAALLGMVIFALGILALRNRRYPEQPIVLPMTLVILVIFQALLGMWTVSLKLFPFVVMAHLLGGLTTLALLWWLVLKLKPVQDPNFSAHHLRGLRILAMIGLFVLAVQLFLGGWTSANYAALVCIDFPYCQGTLIPPLNFVKAFDLGAGVVGSAGTPLDNTARVTIHMVHRFGAIVTALIIGWLAFSVFARARSLAVRFLSVVIAVLLTIQIFLGVTNVVAMLPLHIAIAHTGVGALLLLALVTLTYYLQSIPKRRP